MSQENLWENVSERSEENEGFEDDAPQRRSKVIMERVALVVLSLLLLAPIFALVGVMVRVERGSTTMMTAPEETTTAPPCVLHCDEDWVINGTKCYYFSSKNDKLPWKNSRDECRHHSGALVKIESREEQKFVLSKLSGDDWFWIGLSDSDTEGHWKWTDGSALNRSLAFWWKEPDDWNGHYNEHHEGEDCAVILLQYGISGDKNWADVHCPLSNRFICEKAPACVSQPPKVK